MEEIKHESTKDCDAYSGLRYTSKSLQDSYSFFLPLRTVPPTTKDFLN